MTNAESERLFAALKKIHPSWTNRFCSGYVHGVQDEALRTNPQQIEVDKAAYLDHYALGYLTAFVVHRGEDVEQEKWFSYVGLLVDGIKNETP